MTDLPRSELFSSAFLDGPSTFSAGRGRLLESYRAVRRRAGILAGDIAASMPSLTVHDGGHLDALWEMADVVARPQVELNTAEAYVLGVSILIHDLGLAVAAYPGGYQGIEADALWLDTLASVIRTNLGRTATGDELHEPSAECRQIATEVILRRRHAEKADQLATFAWRDSAEHSYYLIEDSDLRATYGPLIGRIAHSHWWPTGRLSDEFGRDYGAPGLPAEWRVDPLKLACLLRLADAIHLDERRAPRFLRVLRRPGGLSRGHWEFQARLNRPYREDDRLAFTAASAFGPDEAEAWWLCRDTLVDVDRWLREADALLADLGRQRFAVRGVVAVEDPIRLAERIRTAGWRPVDTSVHVADVVRLVRVLGGRQLYGDYSLAAIRELIQNATDAVRARRILRHLESSWGEVRVRLQQRGGRWWLEVSDTGVGMTDDVLINGLLSFGTSYWSSPAVIDAYPGLLAGGFESTGRFGIGFFSIFMVADHVVVTTRPLAAGEADTRLLEFKEGLTSRPLLRKATPQEMLHDPGTAVSVRLIDPPLSRGGVFGGHTGRGPAAEICAWLCPTLDVTLTVDYEGVTQTAVHANDWLTIPEWELLRRVVTRPDQTAPALAHGQLVRPILSSEGHVLGRCGIDSLVEHETERSKRGVVTVGGLRAAELQYLDGALVGATSNAARDTAVPLADSEDMSRWATEQATLVEGLALSDERQVELASPLSVLRADLGGLKIALTAGGYLSLPEVAVWAREHNVIVMVQDASAGLARRDQGLAEFAPNVIVVDVGWVAFVVGRSRDFVPWLLIWTASGPRGLRDAKTWPLM